MDSSLTSDPELLIYLLAYFDVMGAPPAGTLIKFGDSGPRLAAKKGNTLFLAKNASRDLFPKKLAQEAGKVKGQNRVTVEFNNTLFEQLTEELSTREFITKLLEDQFHISIAPVADDQREMTHKEATQVLKQLADLPLFVAKEMKLKSIVRMRAGGKGDIAGEYSKANETIRLYDLAFRGGPTEGEGTVLHEFGHALWEGMPDYYRARFTQLSWDDSILGKAKQKKTFNFVSKYSQKSPEEDFAEHFSAFVNNREWLLRQAPDKESFLSDMFNSYYLDDSTYSAGGHEKSKIGIKSDRPDVTAPQFAGNLKDLITLRAKLIEETKELEVTCIAEKLFDDISGVKELSWQLTDPKREKFECFLTGVCTDVKLGRYEASKRIPLSSISPETALKLTWGMTTDHAGNERYLNPPEQSIPVSGSYRAKSRPRSGLSERLKEVKIELLPVGDGLEPAYRITLPIAPSPELKSIRLDWEVEKRPDYDCSHYFGSGEFEPSKDGKSLTADFFFKGHLPKGPASLAKIYLSYRETPALEEGSESISIGKFFPNFKIQLNPSSPDNDVLDPQLNSLEMDPITSLEPNKRGGRNSLNFRMPLHGIGPRQSAEVYVTLRSPTGKEISEWTDVNMKEGNAEFRFDLATNPERGEYRVVSLYFSKEYSDRYRSLPGAKVNHDLYSPGAIKLKLLDRNIKRTFDFSE